MIKKYRVLTERPGWEQTPDGIMPPPAALPPPRIPLNKYWNLIKSDTVGNVTIDPGTIASNADSIEASVTISNIATEQTPEAGDVLVLKFTDAQPTTCTIEVLDTWTDHPSPYEIDGTPEFVAYYYPLYYFQSTDTGQKIDDDIYAVRVAPDTCFRSIIGIHQVGGTGIGHSVPVLISSHEVLPATIT